jgi:ferredoxin-nitrate reductase
MNFNGFNFNNTEEVSGILSDDKKHEYGYFLFKLQSIKNRRNTFQWPVPDYGHPGTPRLLPTKNFIRLRKKQYLISQPH